MSDITYVGQSLRQFELSPQFDGYSKVILRASDEVEYVAGDDTGRTLVIESPWSTQQAANNLLSRIRGFQYQPYVANGAQVDPAAELGDGVTVNNVYGGLFTQSLRFSRLATSDISAPSEEAIDHEYPYKPKQDRHITRSLNHLTSELRIQANEIAAEVSERKSDVASLSGQLSVQAEQIQAKVSKTGGSASTFGWILNDTSWTIQSNGATVLRATASGLEVQGTIRATGGTIGGFTITNDSLAFNNHTWGGTNSNGVYLGPNGLQLGKNFKVDNAGNLTAVSGTFTGAVRAGSIQYGGNNGYLSGGGISSGSISGGSGGQVAESTLSTYNLTGGINTSLGYADWSYGALSGWNLISLLSTNSLVTRSLEVDSRTASWKYGSFLDGSGNVKYVYYLGA